jgi:hypothetical protein
LFEFEMLRGMRLAQSIRRGSPCRFDLPHGALRKTG